MGRLTDDEARAFQQAFEQGILSTSQMRRQWSFDPAAGIGRRGGHRKGNGAGGGAGPGGGAGCSYCGAPANAHAPGCPAAKSGAVPDAATGAPAGPGAGLEPFHGWKAARLYPGRVLEGGDPFGSMNDDHPYGVYAHAICGYGYDHRPPDEGCHCGFYAKAERADAEKLLRAAGTVLLEVELYGKVIPGTIGYRGEKQRVLAAWVRRADLWGRACSAPGCPHRTLFEIVYSEVPVCAFHALAQDYRFREVPEAPVPDIGTEWRWIDDELPPARAPRVSTDPKARGSIWTGPAS